MSVLILHRNPFEPFPYHRWLDDYPGDLVVLAARDKIEQAGEEVPTGEGYARLELLADFHDGQAVVERALELAADFAVRHVVAHHEGDVDPAAELRQRLDLPGARPRDVLPFRDKALMKDRLVAAGVEVAEYTVPRTADQARAFARRHGYPLVSKERDGFNAIGLHVLRDADALEEHLAGAYAGGERDDLLLESYVPGRMCHVDGLVVNGRTVLAWPSQYQYDLASFGADPGARIDLTLDVDDPLTPRLLDLADRALAALRRPGGGLVTHGFHAEVFHTPDDRLVVCEIACRPGGAKIREVFEAAFGVNLGHYATRAQVGLELPALAESLRAGVRPRPSAMAGQVLMMKRPGQVRALPPVPSDPWVERFWRYSHEGEVVPPAGGSSDFLLAAVGSGPNRTACERRLRALGARFEAQTEVVRVP